MLVQDFLEVGAQDADLDLGHVAGGLERGGVFLALARRVLGEVVHGVHLRRGHPLLRPGHVDPPELPDAVADEVSAASWPGVVRVPSASAHYVAAERLQRPVWRVRGFMSPRSSLVVPCADVMAQARPHTPEGRQQLRFRPRRTGRGAERGVPHSQGVNRHFCGFRSQSCCTTGAPL